MQVLRECEPAVGSHRQKIGQTQLLFFALHRMMVLPLCLGLCLKAATKQKPDMFVCCEGRIHAETCQTGGCPPLPLELVRPH